jgi:hypothetical protein
MHLCVIHGVRCLFDILPDALFELLVVVAVIFGNSAPASSSFSLLLSSQ